MTRRKVTPKTFSSSSSAAAAAAAACDSDDAARAAQPFHRILFDALLPRKRSQYYAKGGAAQRVGT